MKPKCIIYSICKFLTFFVFTCMLSCEFSTLKPESNTYINDTKPAQANYEYVEKINEILRLHFDDSVKSANFYHRKYIKYPNKQEGFDEKETIVSVHTFKDSKYEFDFYKYAEGYGVIIKDGEVVYVNTDFPLLPNPQNLEFKE